MDFNSTVDLIIRDLNEAKEIIDDLKNYPGVPVLQVELAKSKCKNAAEVIALLKDGNYGKTPSPAPAIKKVSPPAAEKVKQEPVKQSEENKTRNMETPVVRQDKTRKQEILADTFEDQRSSLNDQMSTLREDEDVAGILKSKPVTDLKAAIGVADKFLFIREIFMGNPESYEKAITKLNSAATIDEAKALIQDFSGNTESEAASQLLDLVKRKFPGNE